MQRFSALCPLAGLAANLRVQIDGVDNWPMAASPWQQRIERAQELIDEYDFAAEILGFYIHIARFQEQFYRWLERCALQSPPQLDRELSATEVSQLSSRFTEFLSLVETHGPRQLQEISRGLRMRGSDSWAALLNAGWRLLAPAEAQHYLALAYLQPYAELVRSRALPRANQQRYALCPFCHRKPGLGVMRPMGEGAARSLICMFCLAEWPFRRLVCPGCGEESDRELVVFTASQFEHIRVECCDTCKTYIKTIDLSKNGRAEPVVDELAAVPLDLWAHERGYAKLQNNLLGM